MNLTTPLLLPLLQQLEPLTKNISCRAEERWAVIFESCPAAKTIDSTTLSHLKHGRRRLSPKYAAHYADLASPHIPPRLYNDLSAALAKMHTTTSEKRQMLVLLKEFILNNIDPVDHLELLPASFPNIPTSCEVLTLWTRVTWFCLCHDIAGC